MSELAFVCPAFCARYGATPTDDAIITQSLPALISGIDRMAIDLTPLLVFGKMRMDSHAFQRIVTNDEPALSGLSKTLSMLYQYELLETYNMGDFSPVQQSFIEARVEEALETRDQWLSFSKQCIDEWRASNGLFRPAYGVNLRSVRKIPFLLMGAMSELHQNLTVKNSNQFYEVAFGTSENSEEAEEIQNACIRTAATYTACAEVWRSNTMSGVHSPLHDWDNLTNLVSKNDAWKYENFITEQKISVTKYTIETYAGQPAHSLDIEKYVSFLRSKHIDNFRALISECVEACVDLEREDNKALLALIDNANMQDEIRPVKIAVTLLAPGAGELTEFGSAILGQSANSIARDILDNYSDAAIEECSKNSWPTQALPLRIKVGKAIRKHFV